MHWPLSGYRFVIQSQDVELKVKGLPSTRLHPMYTDLRIRYLEGEPAQFPFSTDSKFGKFLDSRLE